MICTIEISAYHQLATFGSSSNKSLNTTSCVRDSPVNPSRKRVTKGGFDCAQWGDLFDYVVKSFAAPRKPRFLLIENVPNLMRHAEGETWRRMGRRLEDCGYAIDVEIFSPHHVGVPQIRERAIIVGDRCGLTGFQWPEKRPSEDDLDIRKVLDIQPAEARVLNDRFLQYLSTWQELIEALPKDEQLPSFPIWAMEFGATYPFQDKSPWVIGYKNIRSFRGAFGRPLTNSSSQAVRAAPPSVRPGQVQSVPRMEEEFHTTEPRVLSPP